MTSPANSDPQDARTDPPSAGSRLMRAGLIASGLLVIALGVVIAPLPGPGGIPVIGAGLVIILRNSFWARRRFVELNRRHPRYVSPVRRLLRRDVSLAEHLRSLNPLRMLRRADPSR